MILTFHGNQLASWQGLRGIDRWENFQNNGKSCDREIKLIIRVFPFDLKSVKFRHARISHYFEILLNNSELYSIDRTA